MLRVQDGYWSGYSMFRIIIGDISIPPPSIVKPSKHTGQQDHGRYSSLSFEDISKITISV